MTFTLDNIINSVAGVLKERYGGYPVYTSANQQGTKFPCFFIFFLPSTIESQTDRRFLRDLAMDIIFVQQRNIVNGNAGLREIADYLDERLELIPYSDGSGELAYIPTYERQWQSEDGELHYQFHIRQRVVVAENNVLMREMEENNAKVK